MPLPKKNPKKSPRGKATKTSPNSKRKLETSPGTDEIKPASRRPKITLIPRKIEKSATKSSEDTLTRDTTDMNDQKLMEKFDKKLDKICEEQEFSRKLATEALSINTETLTKVTSLQSDMTLVNEKITAHDSEIAQLKVSNNSTNNEILSLKKRLNYFEQKAFDNELAITGFSKIPSEPELTKICSLLMFDRNKIIHAHSFQLKKRDNVFTPNNRDNEIKMILRFSAKESLIEFRSAAGKFGPLIPTQHLENSSTGAVSKNSFSSVVKDDAKTGALQLRNVYSSTNKKINWIIRQMLASKKISGIRYRDCTFRIKLPNALEELIVSTIEYAEHLSMTLTPIEPNNL